MADWHDTPPEAIVWAERPDGERVRFSELRVGEVFRAVFGNTYVEPWPDHEPTDSWFKVCDEPRHADGTEVPQEFGWCFACEEIPTEAEMRRALS